MHAAELFEREYEAVKSGEIRYETLRIFAWAFRASPRLFRRCYCSTGSGVAREFSGSKVLRRKRPDAEASPVRLRDPKQALWRATAQVKIGKMPVATWKMRRFSERESRVSNVRVMVFWRNAQCIVREMLDCLHKHNFLLSFIYTFILHMRERAIHSNIVKDELVL